MSFSLGAPSVTISDGISSNLITAAVGVNAWNDIDLKFVEFRNNADVLPGSYFIQGPLILLENTHITITTYGPADIYVAHEADVRSGGFSTSFPSNGWSQLDGQVQTDRWNLNKIWKKTLAQGATTVITPTQPFVGSIFVKGTI